MNGLMPSFDNEEVARRNQINGSNANLIEQTAEFARSSSSAVGAGANSGISTNT
jgi:hypothetical protein